MLDYNLYNLTLRFNIVLEEFSRKKCFVGNNAKMNDFATY